MKQFRSGSRARHNKSDVFAELRSRGLTKSRNYQPKGGVHLRQILPEKVQMYLAGRVRDQRSFETRNSKGVIHDPILTYWTFVNFSRAYRMNGERECVRRCPLWYTEFQPQP